MLHQLSRVQDSITLSWPQPDRPNGDILEYQLRYYDKVINVKIQFLQQCLTHFYILALFSLMPFQICLLSIEHKKNEDFKEWHWSLF